MLTRGGICVPPTVTYLPYRVSGTTLTAVGSSQLLARWPGTHSRILSGIQRAAQTLLGVYLKRTCSPVTSASSALGVLTIMHHTNPRSLLTHSQSHTPVLRPFVRDYLDFTEERDNQWQRHQLGHMQVCTSLQTDNHTSTPPLSFLQAGCPSCRPTNSAKALKVHLQQWMTGN